MKKILSIIMALTLGMMILGGCSSKKELKMTVSFEQMDEVIKDNAGVKNTKFVSLNEIEGLSLESEWIKEGIYSVPEENSESTLFIVEGKTKDDMKNIKDKFNEYLGDSTKGVVTTKGNYVMLVIAGDKTRAASIFEGNIN